MAKLAVFFVTAVAVQTVFGGIISKDVSSPMETPMMGGLQWDRSDLQSYGQYEMLYKQMGNIVQQLDGVQPYDRSAINTLMRQSRELVYYMDVVMTRLQSMMNIYPSEIQVILMQFIGQWRPIQQSFQQLSADDASSAQWMRLFNANIRSLYEAMGMMMRLCQGRQLEGGLCQVMYDFLYYFVKNCSLSGSPAVGDNYYMGRQYYGDKDKNMMYYGGMSGGLRISSTNPMELYYRIQSMMKQMNMLLENSQMDIQLLSMQMRYFVQMLRNVVIRLESYQNQDAIREVVYRLREVLMMLEQMSFADVQQVRMELYKCFEVMLMQFQTLCMYVQDGVEGELYIIVTDVFKYFLRALDRMCYAMISGSMGMMNMMGMNMMGMNMMRMRGMGMMGMRGMGMDNMPNMYSMNRMGSMYGMDRMGSMSNNYMPSGYMRSVSV